ncbi:MAG: hypothetical protein C4555_05200 [Dehalococcoidia bacterium]|nr:MAG: hypothetical protein C4555_05200 [Dehalococcoidia bacterium]
MGASGGGGGGGSSSPFPTYQYSNMGTSDYNASAGINTLAADKSLYNIFQQANQSLGYIPQSPSGYNPQEVVQAGTNVVDAAKALPLYAMRVADLALDPQSQIYNSLQREMMERTRARNAFSGLENTPYAAGIEGSNLASLQTGWQNNLLNRAVQGGQSIQGLIGQFGDTTKTGEAIMASAPTMQMAVSQGLAGLAGNYLAQQQQAISDWLQYLGQGTQANAVGVQAQSAADQANLQRMQMQQQAQQNAMGMGMQAAGMLLGGKG